MSRKRLLDLIVRNNLSAAERILRENPSLAQILIPKPKLYLGQIAHWIYVGDTPLHLAAAGRRVEITNLLLAAGADPNAHGNHRQSAPLHYAADSDPQAGELESERQVRTMQLLVEAGAKIDAPDKNGATPLHRAVRTRGAEAVEFLLDAGADLTVKNYPGSSAFHLAVQDTGRGGSGSAEAITGQRKIIEILLSRGANPRAKDGKGKTVLARARSLWIQEMLKP